jgi:RNA polymerase primary sigma factor
MSQRAQDETDPLLLIDEEADAQYQRMLAETVTAASENGEAASNEVRHDDSTGTDDGPETPEANDSAWDELVSALGLDDMAPPQSRAPIVTAERAPNKRDTEGQKREDDIVGIFHGYKDHPQVRREVDGRLTKKLVEESLVDTVSDYLNDIGRMPLLTRKEAYELFGRIEAGLAVFRNARDSGVTMQNIEPLLISLAAAYEIVYRSNLRLVVNYAAPFSRKTGLHLGDMIQEGNEGLKLAICRFDREKGFQFSTYATWWIKQSLQRAEPRYKMIRVQNTPFERWNQLKRVTHQLEIKLQRSATDDEVAAALDVTREELYEIRRAGTSEPVSLQQIVGESGSELGDFVGSESDTEDAMQSLMTNEGLQQFVEEIGIRQRDLAVVSFRYQVPFKTLEGEEIETAYGNFSYERLFALLTKLEYVTLDKLGVVFGFTKEAIRQQEARVMVRFKDNASRLMDLLAHD